MVRAFTHGAMGHQNKPPMLDPFSYFSFQPVLHNWYNKGCGMCYPAYGMMHIKEPLLLIGKKVAHVAAAGLLTRYPSGPLSYV